MLRNRRCREKWSPALAPLFKAVAVTYCDGFSFLFRAVAKRGEKAPFGPECAKPCLCAGAFTLKIGSALCLARHRQMTLPPSAPSHSAKRPILHRQAFPSPFRYVCPELYRKQGKAELHWTTGASKRPKRQDSGPGSMPLAQSVIPDAV